MSFFKQHFIKLSNSDKEYKLIIKIDNDNRIEFDILNKENNLDENYSTKISLTEFKALNSFFKMFDSIMDCAETLSNIIRDSNPRLLIESNKASLFISLFLPGQKPKEIEISLDKKSLEINSLFQEINALKSRVNDLEMKINQKDLIIERIQINYDNLKRDYDLFVQQCQTDIINLKSMIPKIPNNINNNNPNLRTVQQQMESNNNEMSTIINNQLELNFLSNKFRLLYPGKSVIYNLLYRKSRDSDKASIFHSKCDKIRGTITIIKTSNGLKLGGYTNETWEGNNINKSDNTAFIFSLNNNKIYNIKNNVNAIFCSPNYGPFFDGNTNPTLVIYDNSNTNGGECCKAIESNYIGYSSDYEINNEHKKFKIADLEVFKVTIV